MSAASIKVFLRSFNPHVNERTGAPLPDGTRLSASDRWLRFEQVLKECIEEQGHKIIEQPANPLIPDDAQDAAFSIYSHLTKRERPCGNLFHKEMHLAGLFTLDAQGWGADHSGMRERPPFDDVDIKEAERFAKTLRSEFLIDGRSKHPQPELKLVDQVEDYVLAALQVPRDYVINHHSHLSVLQFINMVSAWADKARQNVVFKLHPGNIKDPDIIRAVEQRTGSSRYVFSRSGNIHNLIAQSKGVFVINSGVGFESLIHGKPVVTFGNCDYKWVTFRANDRNLDEALDYINGYREESQYAAYKFIYYYHWRHAFSVRDDTIEITKRRLGKFLADAIRSATSSN